MSTLTYYQTLASEQREVAGLYIAACLAQARQEQAFHDVLSGDTLLRYAYLRRNGGYITDYELNQIRTEQLQAHNTKEDSEADVQKAMLALKSRLGLMEDLSVEMPDRGALPLSLDEDEVRMVRFHIQQILSPFIVERHHLGPVLAVSLYRSQFLRIDFCPQSIIVPECRESALRTDAGSCQYYDMFHAFFFKLTAQRYTLSFKE